jgi:hypothetical protein
MIIEVNHNKLNENEICKVPGSKNEYFDCCNRVSLSSENTDAICNIIGTINFSLLTIIFTFAFCILII